MAKDKDEAPEITSITSSDVEPVPEDQRSGNIQPAQPKAAKTEG